MTGVQTCALPICFPVTIQPSGQRVKQKLNKLANTKIENADPQDINGFVQRLFAELSLPQYRDQVAIKDNKRVAELVDQSFQLMDYATYLNSVKLAKQEIAAKTINRLKADGFAYADALYDENWDKRSQDEWRAHIQNYRPNDIINGSGMTWSGYLTAATSAAGAGGTYGTFAGPVGTAAGTLGGFVAGTVGYLGSKGINYLYNTFAGDEGDNIGLAHAQTSAFGQNTLSEEYAAMDDVIKEAAEGNKVDWQLPVVDSKVNAYESCWRWAITVIINIFIINAR